MRSRILALPALLLACAVAQAGPSRFGFSDRIERHLFPEVTTGPAEPSWSPDGQWIAFSMHGDIWKIPAAGGEAIALTRGPAYHFEPAWSPDGTSIAFSMDTDGNLDIGVVPAAGGTVRRLTDDRAVDIEPAWTADSGELVFVSSRSRGFDIFKLSVGDGRVTPAITGPGDQIQPSVSPDGRTIVYVSPVAGRLGAGGIWTQPATGGTPTLVHYEESEYRMRPRWTPDGTAIVYGSDERGSNDIAIVPARGGNPHVITNDGMGEFSPAPSPDGRELAFISNRRGPMTLHVAPAGGGPLSSWREVRITSRRWPTPMGRLRGRVLGPDGRSVPARIQIRASDGRAYAPDDGFARVIAVSETHYFHAQGEFDVVVPAGPVDVEARRGLEFAVASARVDVRPDAVAAPITLRLRRIAEPARDGWYSGDTHAHDLHQGRFGLTHRTLFEQSLAEDLHLTHVLIHMDGTRLMGRWEDLTGEPHPLSTRTHILQFAQEFRGSLGHIGLLGISRYVLPLTGGVTNTAYAQTTGDTPYLDGARAQGGIAGFMHPYLNRSDTPAGWAGSLIPVDVALGKGDFYDVSSLYSDELASAEMYYKLLNCWFRLAATGGTDNFPDVWRDPPPGTNRTYARVEGPLNVSSWLAAVRAGRTFATTGPLLFLTVRGAGPGGELRLTSADASTLPVHVRVASIARLDRLEILVNGAIVKTVALEDAAVSKGIEIDETVAMPDAGWIAARVIGPPSRDVADSYAFAHTTPVYVVRNGRTFVSHADAAFLAEVVDAIWARADRGPWRSDAERAAFKNEIDRARARYLELGIAR